METRFLKSLPYFFGIVFVLFLTINDKEILSIAIIIVVIAWFIYDYYKSKGSTENKEDKN